MGKVLYEKKKKSFQLVRDFISEFEFNIIYINLMQNFAVTYIVLFDQKYVHVWLPEKSIDDLFAAHVYVCDYNYIYIYKC